MHEEIREFISAFEKLSPLAMTVINEQDEAAKKIPPMFWYWLGKMQGHLMNIKEQTDYEELNF